MITTTGTAAPPEVLEALQRAADLAEGTLRHLNTRHSLCAGCGSKHWEDFRQANAHDAIAGMVGKLRKWADALAHPEEYTHRGVHHEDMDEQANLRRRMRGRATSRRRTSNNGNT